MRRVAAAIYHLEEPATSGMREEEEEERQLRERGLPPGCEQAGKPRERERERERR